MSIRIQRASKRFGDRVILRDVTIEVPTGNWLSILGTSGSGKTTLLNLVAGLDTPDTGHIALVAERRTSGRSCVGYMLQSFPLYPSLRVEENLTFALRRSDREGPSLLTVIEALGLGAILGQLPATLSGGERQRVALGRTLLLNRSILLLDEPFANVAVSQRRDLRRFVRRLAQEWAWTVILVTHDQEDAIASSDVVAVLEDGLILQTGAPRDLYDAPETLGVGRSFGDLDLATVPLHDPIGIVSAAGGENYYEDVDLILGLREDQFVWSAEPALGFAEVELLQREFLGSRWRYIVCAEGKAFSVVLAEELALDARTLWLKPAGKIALFSGGRRLG